VRDEAVPGPGETFGHYRLERELGRGAMGIVYLATHERLGRAVALKLLRPELGADETYRRRFLREARIAAEVEHENLVPIVEAGELAGRQFLASEHVPGQTLAERLRAQGGLPLDGVLRIAAELGAALDALHARGLLHRDVKPSNVLLDEAGRALLADFGLATGPAHTVLTRPGQLLGTVEYMAPELIRGEPASSASDLYALGCLLYACAAGRPPFVRASPFQVTVAHLSEQPPDPGATRPELPARFGGALLQALAKEPGERPTSARAYALALWGAARS
jgi:serine/threonine-protein kinase